MEWITQFNKAIDYMEAHLTEETDLERLGQIACCSAYHFQRMFGYMAGIPLSEYVRRRRMSLAAADLQGGSAKIVDIALKYGYDSPTAFNRAFQSVHGFPPSGAKTEGVILRSYPPISLQITVKGATKMDYKIEKKDAFRIVGVSTPLEAEVEKNFATVPGFWQKTAMGDTIPRLAGMMNSAPMGILGVSACDEKAENWRYYIAAASTQPAQDFEEYTVPAATWAVFSGEGTTAEMQDLERRIVSDWLPTSGYEYANAPDIEVYLEPNPMHAKYEVWIPVVKKA